MSSSWDTRFYEGITYQFTRGIETKMLINTLYQTSIIILKYKLNNKIRKLQCGKIKSSLCHLHYSQGSAGMEKSRKSRKWKKLNILDRHKVTHGVNVSLWLQCNMLPSG